MNTEEMLRAVQNASAALDKMQEIVKNRDEFIAQARRRLRGDMDADIGTGRSGWFGVRGETIRFILGGQ